MKEKHIRNVEAVFIVIVSTFFFFYIIHPILADIAPILTFGSGGSNGFRRPSGLGVLSMVVTGIVIMYVYYFVRASIEYIHSYGAKPFFANIGLIFLIIIPNKILPKRFRPKNIRDLQELEDQYK